MIDSGFTLFTDIGALGRAAAGAVAVVMVVWTFVRVRAFIPVLGSVILGGLVLWAVTGDGLGWFSDRIEDDATRLEPGAIVHYEPASGTTLVA